MNTPTQTGGESATPRTDAEFALKEIKELALAIRRNLKEDASPRVQDDMWAITAAAHALVILDNVAILERETATLHAQIARLQQRDGELVGALQRLLRAFESDYEQLPHIDMATCWLTNSQAVDQARAALQSVAKEGEK